MTIGLLIAVDECFQFPGSDLAQSSEGPQGDGASCRGEKANRRIPPPMKKFSGIHRDPATCEAKPQTAEELDKVALSLFLKHGAMSCTDLGVWIWGRPYRPPQSYARPAGRIVARLVRKEWLMNYPSKRRILYTLTDEGKKHATDTIQSSEPKLRPAGRDKSK